MFAVPDAVTVRRAFSLDGVDVPAGTSLSAAQVEALGARLNALLDGGWVVASPDPFARRGRERPRPSSLPPVIRNEMIRRLNPSPPVPLGLKCTAVGLSISCEVEGGVPSFTLTLKDESLEVIDSRSGSGRTFMFTVPDGGQYIVTVTDGQGASTWQKVVIQSASLSAKARVSGRSVTVTVKNGVPPFTVSTPGEETMSGEGRTFSFTAHGVGTHEVEVVDAAGAKAVTAFNLVVAGGKGHSVDDQVTDSVTGDGAS